MSVPKAHKSFELKRSQTIDSLNLTISEYEHKKTGALHYHLDADNDENVFFVALRTVPTDSTGVAHMLEHTALCGSEKYPVRDPFFMMLRRSLNTFMNAFTSSDWTAYPFASQNKKDFNNLLDVYLDAVFFSRLDPMDFSQEGHRLEFSEENNPDSELVFKGVVFNEMKGSMSSPVSKLWHTLCHHLYPITTYHFNSGGEPEEITNLTYEGLKSFYKTHYNPSNAIFFSYGDIPAHEHQAKFEDRALNRFERLDKTIKVGPERRYDAPITVTDDYAYDDQEQADEKTYIVLAWLLGETTDLEQLMKARFLANVLLLDSASPLLQALETTDLAAAPAPICGLEDSHYEMAFVCGVEGSKPEHADAVEKLILNVLEDVAKNGVPQERLETVLHQVELHQREITGGSYPYGLQLILHGLAGAIHYGDPMALLDVDPVLNKLREWIQDPEFIKNLVQEYLLDNPHRVRLMMKPDTELSQQQTEDEKQRLAKIKAELSEEDKQKIIEQSEALKKRQEQLDNIDILPKVTTSDIPETIHIPPILTKKYNELTVNCCEQGTNGLVYQDIIVALPDLSEQELELLPYYTTCLTELGCGETDYLGMQDKQSQVSGGLHASTVMRSQINDVQTVKSEFVLGGKALKRNHAKLSELLAETFQHVKFDEHQRMAELIAQTRAQQNQSITGNGHGLAMMAAASGMSAGAALSHRLYGLAGICYINKLDDSFEDKVNIQQFAERMQALHQRIINLPREFLLVAEPDQDDLQQQIADIWSQVPMQESDTHFGLQSVTQQQKQLWVVNTQVNFCARVYPTVPIEHPDAAALAILGPILRNGYLHTAIREKGGAYGGGAVQDMGTASFRFFSYRDPRLEETFKDFDNAIEWVIETKHEKRALEEAILNVVSSIDKPSSPAGEAKKAFYNALHGRTPEQRQEARARILKVTLDDVQRVAGKYLQMDKASIAVVTNAATLDKVGDLGLEVWRV